MCVCISLPTFPDLAPVPQPGFSLRLAFKQVLSRRTPFRVCLSCRQHRSQILLSARSKVERANHHIRDIERWLRAYRDRNAHSVQIGTDAGEDSDGSGVRITNPAVQLPAEDLPCAVGDAVHNLRSALDHIAAAIYLAAGVNPEEATFPIDKDRKSLVRKRKYQEIERLAPGLAKIISDYECMNGVGDRLIA
jgi:hypothetical protein